MKADTFVGGADFFHVAFTRWYDEIFRAALDQRIVIPSVCARARPHRPPSPEHHPIGYNLQSVQLPICEHCH
jgi:hypothetical protein